MVDNEVASDKVPDGDSSPVQPSQSAPSAAVGITPSDPNLVSIKALRPGESRCFLIPGLLN